MMVMELVQLGEGAVGAMCDVVRNSAAEGSAVVLVEGLAATVGEADIAAGQEG